MCIFKCGGYGHLRILSACLRRIHLKEIRQIKLVSSNKDLARVSEGPASKLYCDSKFFICPTNVHNSYKLFT